MNAVTVVVAVTIAWSVASFGGVYPWAQAPVVVACVCVFALSWLPLIGEQRRSLPRGLLIAMLVMQLAALCQTLPLPASFVSASGSGQAFRLQATSLAPVVGWGSLSVWPRLTWEVLGWWTALILLFVGLLRTLTPAGAAQVAGFTALVGFAVALVTLAQGNNEYVYGFWRPGGVAQPAGPFINRNHLAGWMLLSLGLTLGLCGRLIAGWRPSGVPGIRGTFLRLFSAEGSKLLLLALASVAMCAAVIASGSRSGLVAGGVLAFSLVAFGFGRVREAGAGVRSALYVGAVVLMAGTLMWVARQEIANRIASGQQSWTSRVGVWKDSVGAMRDFPIAGSGLGTFGLVFPRYRPATLGDGFQEAHNDYVQLAVEGGLLVVVPFLWLIWCVMRASIRALGRVADDGERYWPRAGAMGGVLALGLQEIVEFSVRTPSVAVLLVVALATTLSTQVDEPWQ